MWELIFSDLEPIFGDYFLKIHLLFQDQNLMIEHTDV